MVEGAEQQLDDVAHLNEHDGPVFKAANDPRLTWPGRLMRRFSFDEFPQLWNVLRGEMSLVGPRPPLPNEVARYERWQRRRLSMKPGVTGLWQVSGRNDIKSFEDWINLDLSVHRQLEPLPRRQDPPPHHPDRPDRPRRAVTAPAPGPGECESTRDRRLGPRRAIVGDHLENVSIGRYLEVSIC